MNKIILTLTLVLSLTLVAQAQAKDSIYLQVGGFSKHFESKKTNGDDFNGNHKNIGLEWESDWDWLENTFAESFEEYDWLQGDYYFSFMAQHMDNSLDEDSTLVGAAWKRKWNLDWEENWKFGIGGVFGVQNGYPKVGKRSEDTFVPIALPLVELSYKRVGAYVTCAPKVHTSGFCFVGFKLKAYEF